LVVRLTSSFCTDGTICHDIEFCRRGLCLFVGDIKHAGQVVGLRLCPSRRLLS